MITSDVSLDEEIFLKFYNQALTQLVSFFEVYGELRVAHLCLVSLAERGSIVAVVVGELIGIVAA